MTVEEGVFYVFAGLTVIAGLGVVLLRNVVYAALALIVALLAVAGIFLLLSAEFLALVQILIYGGAVAILMLFALMLTRVRDMPVAMDNPQRPLAALAAAALLSVFILAAVGGAWPGDVEQINAIPLQDFGESLFTTWALPFEIASLVLIVALIGAIVIAGVEEGE